MSLIPYQITIPQWLALDSQIRQRLITLFNIPRSEGTSVVNNTVVSDGHSHKDLAHISLEKMCEVLGESSEDYFGTLNKVIEKIVAEIEEEKVKELEASKEVELQHIADNNRAILNNVAKLLLNAAPPVKEEPKPSPKKK